MKLPDELLDTLLEPVLVFNTTGRLSFSNPAALRRLGCEPGMSLADLGPALGEGLRDRVHDALANGLSDAAVPANPLGGPVPTLVAVDGGVLLCLPLESASPMRPQPVIHVADKPVHALHDILWDAPFPATWQDEAFRLVDVNDAYLSLVGYTRQELLGRDPLEWTAPEETSRLGHEHSRPPQAGRADGLQRGALELRLVDASGRPRWVRAARYPTVNEQGEHLLMTLLQETTSEHAAREQAERFSRELDQWFDLSPLGMVLFDERGLVLRANQAFEHLIGGVLVELRDASPQVRALLNWGETSGAVDPIDPMGTGAWVTSEGALPQGDGTSRWVRALLRCYEVRSGRRRYMCMLEDRTAEEERDLAQLQLGALVSTAGAGLSTYRTGDAGSPDSRRLTGSAPPPRDQVMAASLPDYERLERAIRQGEPCEVRYAVRDAEQGTRWLITRVEPGRLASGRPTTSVVTIDVTEQHRAQERAEQLLAELSTILENSPAGIASMRGLTLTQCNRRFERMLGLAPGAAVGRVLCDVLALHASAADDAQVLNRVLDEVGLYESEFAVGDVHGGMHWYAVTVRRTGPVGDTAQAIAVVSEITRLKAQQAELEHLAGEHGRMAHVLGQQADRTRAVLDSVLVGIVTVDESGRISWLNRSARRMFGGDLGDFLGQPLGTVATAEPDHPFHGSIRLFGELRDGEAVQFECQVQARDQRNFWVVGNAVATLGVRGDREMTYALMDIDQRRQAEARIAEAQASLQRIIEAAPMAITVCDAASLSVLQINRVAAALCGVAAEQAVGRTLRDLFPAPGATRLRRDLQAALTQPQAVTQREYTVPREGRVEVWDARFLPLSRTGAQVDQILMVATDVTAQRAAQRAELEAAIAQREMLVQEVHHRIKNNLQGVAGLMQQAAVRRPEVQPLIAEVVGQVQAIAQVYGLQVGKVGLLRVGSVVEAIAQSVQRTFGRTIELHTDGADTWHWVFPEAESIPIALTLNELLTNAIKHSRDASPVRCGLRLEEQGIRLEISNVGQLPPDFRIDHRPATVSGLGLVRALLPRRHASLTMNQQGERVVALIVLSPPVVRPEPPRT